jgi:hypothetical protein
MTNPIVDLLMANNSLQIKTLKSNPIVTKLSVNHKLGKVVFASKVTKVFLFLLNIDRKEIDDESSTLQICYNISMMMITIPNVTINLQYPCGELQTFE